MSGSRVYGCLFCLSGQERDVIARLKKRLDLSVIAPVRQHFFRRKGEMSVVEDRVFPGYLFFETDDRNFSVEQFDRLDGVIRLLRYDAQEWMLTGTDAELAEKLFRCGGVIGLSRARFVNGRLQIIEGFLKDYEGDICKVDKRHNAAMIRTKLNGHMTELWLGYELVDEA